MAVHALGKDTLNYIVSLANRGILSAYPLSLSVPSQFLRAAKLMPLGTVGSLARISYNTRPEIPYANSCVYNLN